MEKSKYYLRSPDLPKWINFAKYGYNYWYMDSYDYNNIFASFIDKMKKSFYNSDKIHEIDKNLINSVRKEVTPKVLMTVVVILVDVTWLLLDIYMLMDFN